MENKDVCPSQVFEFADPARVSGNNCSCCRNGNVEKASSRPWNTYKVNAVDCSALDPNSEVNQDATTCVCKEGFTEVGDLKSGGIC